MAFKTFGWRFIRQRRVGNRRATFGAFNDLRETLPVPPSRSLIAVPVASAWLGSDQIGPEVQAPTRRQSKLLAGIPSIITDVGTVLLVPFMYDKGCRGQR